MVPREARVRGGQGSHSTNVNIGGQDVHITVDMGNTKAMGPIHLSGDDRIPSSAVTARTQKELDEQRGLMPARHFSNPAENVRRLGIREGMKVADLGSGSGAYTLALARLVGESGAVYAVDVQRDLLTRIQNQAQEKHYEHVYIVWANIEEAGSVSIRDALLDVVLLSNTLFQCDDKLTPLKEAWRILKPGGTLAIIDWSGSFGGMGPSANAVFTRNEAMLIATDNGFAFKRDFPAGEHHYGLLFVKVGAGQDTHTTLARSQERERDFISSTIAQELV